MGRKIEDYTNNVSANPDLNSVTDLSEKLGATYESRKWTLTDFLTWLNNNVNTNASFDFVNNTGSTIGKGQLVTILGASTGKPTITKYTNSADLNNHSIIYIASDDVLNGATGVFIKEGVVNVPTIPFGAVGDKVYYSTQTQSLVLTNTPEDSVFAGVIVALRIGSIDIFFAPDKDNSILYSTNSNQVALFTGTKKAVGNENFTYVNNVGTEVGYRLTDAPNNNLTQLGIGYLNVETEGLSQNSATRLANWSNSTNKGVLSFRKARGTKAVPTQVFQGDVLGHIIYAGQHNLNGGTTTAIIEVSAVENYDVNQNPLTTNYERYALTQFTISLAPSFSESGILGGFPNNLVFKVDGDGRVSFKNYQFPILDGTSNQVLTTNGAGQLSWGTPSSGVNGAGDANYITGWTDIDTLQNTSWQFDNAINGIKTFVNQWSNVYISPIEGVQISHTRNVGAGATTIQGFKYELITDSLQNYPTLRLCTVRDTDGVPFYAPINQKLGSLEFHGTTAVNGVTCAIKGVATENQTDLAYGGELWFETTANGSFTPVVNMVIKNDGRVTFGGVTYPATGGLAGQVLVTDGFGTMSWQTIGTGAIPALNGNETFRGVNFQNNSTADTTSGGVTLSYSTGSATIARSATSTNYATRQIRKGLYGSTVSGGRYTGVRGTALLWFVTGGFRYVCDFHISDTAFGSGCRQFYGMAGQTTDLGYNDVTLVSSLLNVIGVGSDSADANLQIFHNDGAGACTKINLGSGFPANRTSGAGMTTMYSVVIYNPPNSGFVYIKVENKETGEVADVSIATNIPLDTQGLNFFASRTMGVGITGTGQFDLAILGVYSH